VALLILLNGKALIQRNNSLTGKTGLQGHYEKHGHEFGNINQNQYLNPDLLY
jgi:pyocin large subunit-like protein